MCTRATPISDGEKQIWPSSEEHRKGSFDIRELFDANDIGDEGDFILQSSSDKENSSSPHRNNNKNSNSISDRINNSDRNSNGINNIKNKKQNKNVSEKRTNSVQKDQLTNHQHLLVQRTQDHLESLPHPVDYRFKKLYDSSPLPQSSSTKKILNTQNGDSGDYLNDGFKKRNCQEKNEYDGLSLSDKRFNEGDDQDKN
eukprot:Awhi_evm1s4143